MESKTKKKNQKLPKWFNGDIYPVGETVSNPYTGETADLTAEETSMYDLIKGIEIVIGMGYKVKPSMVEDFEKSLDWFRKNNAKAYMALLD